jgi:hypothetical protein
MHQRFSDKFLELDHPNLLPNCQFVRFAEFVVAVRELSSYSITTRMGSCGGARMLPAEARALRISGRSDHP